MPFTVAGIGVADPAELSSASATGDAFERLYIREDGTDGRRGILAHRSDGPTASMAESTHLRTFWTRSQGYLRPVSIAERIPRVRSPMTMRPSDSGP